MVRQRRGRGRPRFAWVMLALCLVASLALPTAALAARPAGGDERAPLKPLPSLTPAAPATELHGAWSGIDQPLKPLPGLDTALSALAQAYHTQGELASFGGQYGLRFNAGRVQAQVSARPGEEDQVALAVAAAGGEVTSQVAGRLQAWLPTGALASLAAEQAVLGIARPIPLTLLQGAATSEGVASSNANLWHDLGYLGAGVRIGIIDGGFAGYATLVANGELPALLPGVNARNFCDGESDAHLVVGTNHGSACAEIAYDMAPQADYSFAKIGTDLDLAEAVAWMIETRQVDIISTSLAWYNVTPGDGTGYFAELVAAAAAAGVTWVTAAGNEAQVHWGGAFASSTSAANVHTFYGANQPINWLGPGDHVHGYRVPAGATLNVFLRWNDWTEVDQDYDLYLTRWNDVRGAWETVARSADIQDGRPQDRPCETILFTSPSEGLYGVAIQRFSASRPAHFELYLPSQVGLDVREPARSIGNLADVRDALSVGAVQPAMPYDLADYSSHGPTNGPGGVVLGGLLKPDLAAYAAVSTATQAGFAGTSAATPHVAGAAALVKQRYPGYTPDEVRRHLQQQALDLGVSGPDPGYGSGRLYLPVPLAAPVSYGPPAVWSNAYSVQTGGWLGQNLYPRLLGDMNGDGRQDVVGSSAQAVQVALSSGTGLAAAQVWLADLGPGVGAWVSQDRHPRAVGDMDGDGRDDLVIFAEGGVYVARSDGARLATPVAWLAGMAPTAGGWASQERYPRFVGDVDGDDRADVVGFGEGGVMVALSQGDRLGQPQSWLLDFAAGVGDWTSQNTAPRALADMNGDGLADVVGFGHCATYVALSNGSAFGPPQMWLACYGPVAGGWCDLDTFPRVLADVDGDGRADVVGFGARAVYVSLSTGGGLGAARAGIGNYGLLAGGWTSNERFPRLAGDLDADGCADLVGFGNLATYVSLYGG